MARPFRFGLALPYALVDDPVGVAVRAEQIGFDVVVQGDHVGAEHSPMLTLAAVASVTERIRLSTFVLNADVRNPTQLAWEAVTLDHLSDGRFELGVGAGHTPQEYDALGMTQHPAVVRKRRLIEAVEVVRRLVDGETVTVDGEFFRLGGAHVGASVQQRLPILVGGNGATLLEHAGRHADIVGLSGSGRTLDDGHRHEVHWTLEYLDRQIEQIRRGAGDRFDQIELNALVQRVEVTDDRNASLDAMCAHVPGLNRSDAGSVPYMLIGTIDEIVEQLYGARQRWGISYFVVRDLDTFTPVLHALRQTEI